jgi:glycosyltransferase involved in cell wall biosynthesis
MSKPLVSIITPSFNQAEFIEDTIQSVIAQDYPHVEYLIVDGGSTDGSVEIIKKYESQIAWWVSEADEGQASAINKGMAKARGDIVAWLNSDVLFLPGTIGKAVEALLANPDAGFVFGDAITIDAHGCPLKELIFPDWGLEDLVGFRIICQPAVFMRREAFQRVNGLDPHYHFMLDHNLWVRIASKQPGRHISGKWAAARHHGEAKNVSQAASFGRETLEMLDWMEKQDDLRTVIGKNQRKVIAGAHRLNARYLLDGNDYIGALKSYSTAFVNQPLFTAKHWHRIIYACLGAMGVKNLDNFLLRYQESRRPDLRNAEGLQGWPGLCLDENSTL